MIVLQKPGRRPVTFFQRPESAFLQERQLEKLDLLGVLILQRGRIGECLLAIDS